MPRTPSAAVQSIDIEAQHGLSHLATLADYQATRSHIWPTLESARWFIKANKSKLQSCGALLVIAGRVVIDERRFDEAVQEMGRARAAAVQEPSALRNI